MSRLDDLGRIVIPIKIRESLNLKSNSKVDIAMSNGRVIITPCDKICRLCGCMIKDTAKIQLCDGCISNVKKYG